MASTTNYAAGLESNLVQLAYIQETAWGVMPASPKLKAIRFTGESLRGQKTRQRPSEINPSRVASSAVTTDETASGGIDFALSYGTYDDILAGLLGGEWTGDVLTNGLVFKSFLFEKRFAATTLLQYAGSFINSGTLNVARGQFLSGSFGVLAKEEKKAAVSASTGGTYTAAPTGRVMDPVGGVRDVMLDGAAVPAVCNSITLNITNDGAAADFGLGSASAAGMRMGNFMVSGSVEFYFRDFTLYDRFKAETAGLLSFRTLDAAGNSYKFEMPGSTIMNPTVNAGGPGQPIMARFDLEGGDDGNGVALRITRTPAAAP
ncbi:phage tail tube protein [Pseudoroseomonas ludipueritiae]|uniref:Phage tail protein n=1 Tax=Pseudoroseomonas ludipueritiae TaxID=198093 RepID=A0ABR7R4S5_9PROT|nr:phage tail tube protein [Pseudoroseomonas ludipueritiae]MBC9176765.1 hypothetical protein [Pseudoroseomonas ludipueritiae]